MWTIERIRKRPAAIAVAILVSVVGVVSQTSGLSSNPQGPNGPGGNQGLDVNVVNTPTVNIGTAPTISVKDSTSPAQSPVWSAIANGSFDDQSPAMTATYTHPNQGKRAMIRHLTVFCQLPAVADVFMRATGNSGVAPIALSLKTTPYGGNFAYAIGSTPVELMLDAGAFTDFEIIRNDTTAGTANCGVWLAGFQVPQPPAQ
jgi:hypothetical protein